MTFNSGIVVTEVQQVFRNTEDRQVEALYTFPVPEGASVADFTMWIGSREMVGEVVEKERAREIYDSYKRRLQDPGLLEQTDFKTFEMRIFPIGPGAAQRVRIAYYQELDFDNDWATYVYPLSSSPGSARTRRSGRNRPSRMSAWAEGATSGLLPVLRGIGQERRSLSRKAASTFSGVIGRSRMRTPTAS